MIAAIFDIDGTLCANRMGPGIIKYAALHGKLFARFSQFLILLPKYLSMKLGGISQQEYQTSVANSLSCYLKGKDIERGRDLLEWVARHHLLPSQRPSVVQRLSEHQARGDKVMIISGAFRPIVYELAQEWSVHDSIGTEVEAQQGYYTGCILPPQISGQAKVDKMLEYTSSKGTDIDWKSSYAYSDSIVDGPLLEFVGHPVAIHPGRKLKAEAKKRNWEIID